MLRCPWCVGINGVSFGTCDTHGWLEAGDHRPGPRPSRAETVGESGSPRLAHSCPRHRSAGHTSPPTTPTTPRRTTDPAHDVAEQFLNNRTARSVSQAHNSSARTAANSCRKSSRPPAARDHAEGAGRPAPAPRGLVSIRSVPIRCERCRPGSGSGARPSPVRWHRSSPPCRDTATCSGVRAVPRRPGRSRPPAATA